MNNKLLTDWIEKETQDNLPKAKDFEKLAADQNEGICHYNGTYYHGYYNGYLTSLVNLRILLAKQEG